MNETDRQRLVMYLIRIGDLTSAEGQRLLFPDQPPCNLNWAGNASMEAMPVAGTMVYNLGGAK
jgi:hypothetical protein